MTTEWEFKYDVYIPVLGDIPGIVIAQSSGNWYFAVCRAFISEIIPIILRFQRGVEFGTVHGTLILLKNVVCMSWKID